ncbi:Glycosyltransferase involved in cell wall bisynthesis [Butyrivibrio fibrisolvens DSM 3071]|uniref:Glycosyltransferase involved in cell wall bisynthesis n=1 Tax=Butyrivibrio fibrisolvens DSM 3071 TaxID=1121131 RepID=A0A1M6ES03_BUTFI|nr:glycosyltransferase [Butyrivibrio fibrisolvens]SHI88149.1 Glycosyltransferase involved in cell wall bisynthesis [Butyrivibrio fibrisolvens DSM 3071]
MNQKDCLISICIAAYNVERYIEDCVKSVLGQTYSNIEILIIDDGSKDNTGIIIDNYIGVDDRIRVIHKENGGLGSVRNISISESKGEYLLMIDGDDYLTPEMVEIMYKAILKNTADICICDYFIDEIKQSCSFHKEKVLLKDEFMPLILTDDIQSVAWNKLIRRECLDNVLFPSTIVQDIAVMHKVFNNANRIVLLSDKLYVYRDSLFINPNNITNGSASRFESSYYRALYFDDRLIYASEQYKSCTSVLTNKVAGFLCAAYLKAVHEKNHYIEREEIKLRLKELLDRRDAGFHLSIKNKVVVFIILYVSLLVPITSSLYMKKRYKI